MGKSAKFYKKPTLKEKQATKERERKSASSSSQRFHHSAADVAAVKQAAREAAAAARAAEAEAAASSGKPKGRRTLKQKAKQAVGSAGAEGKADRRDYVDQWAGKN